MMEGYTWCRVRCVTGVWASTGDGNEQGFVRGKTRWATSSSRLATLLAREHAGENRRVRFIGRNEMIAAAMYLPRLVNEALRALGKQLVDDGRLDSVSLYSAGPTADFPELDTREWQEDDYDQQGNLLDPIKVKEGKREAIERRSSSTTFTKVNVRNDKVDLTHWQKLWSEHLRSNGFELGASNPALYRSELVNGFCHGHDFVTAASEDQIEIFGKNVAREI